LRHKPFIKVHPPPFYGFSSHPAGSRRCAPTLSSFQLGLPFSPIYTPFGSYDTINKSKLDQAKTNRKIKPDLT